MNILDRYIGVHIIQGFLLVMLVLLPLFTVLDLVQQLDDIGTGTYQLVNALVYEALLLPRYMVDLLPFTALLGSCIALGTLAHGSEIIAMRAAGVSIYTISLATMKTGALIMILSVILQEFVVPPLQQHAVRQQSVAMSGTSVLSKEHGFWIHEGSRFVNVREIMHGRIPSDIDIYQFDERGRLLMYLHADMADISNPKQWLFRNVTQKKLEEGRLLTKQESDIQWESYLTSRQIRVLELPVESLSPSELYRYIQYLGISGQKTNQSELVFWQKVTLPFTTAAMVLLSLPFVFGPLRSASSGKRIILAAIAGIVFQIINQILANLGLLADLNPVMTATLPTAVVLLIAFVYLRSVRAG
jgi:lipopolysaccharide export system permease protein